MPINRMMLKMMMEKPIREESMPVFKELPEWAKERLVFGDSREAYGRDPEGKFRTFYYCSRCDGWIEGFEASKKVNTLNTRRLAGRRGTEYYCIRCGHMTYFTGIMS